MEEIWYLRVSMYVHLCDKKYLCLDILSFFWLLILQWLEIGGVYKTWHFIPANRNGAGPLVFQRAALFKVTIIFQRGDMKTLHVCWYLAVEFLFSVGEDPVPL